MSVPLTQLLHFVCSMSGTSAASMDQHDAVVNSNVSDETIANGSNNDIGKLIQKNKKRKIGAGQLRILCVRGQNLGMLLQMYDKNLKRALAREVKSRL